MHCIKIMWLSIADKPRLLDLDLQTRTVPVFGERFTANCEVVANPLPVCEWTREVFQRGNNSNNKFLDDH